MSSPSLLTVPNVLCFIRILGSGLLLALAWHERTTAAFVLAVVLLLTDWLDGKLAVFLEQRTSFGAKLDSIADLTMYACVIIAVAFLNPGVIRRNEVWIAAAVVSYVLSIATGLLKFRSWPSYHARSAKASWLAAAIAIVSVFAGWADWPVRVALGLVTLANLESTAITLVLHRSDVDVASLFHAFRLRREAAES